MKTRTIRQQVTFKASPHELYELLMDEKKHGQFTRSRTTISRKVGGKISSGDGYIDGINLELVPDKKIVQSWRASDWPEGHYPSHLGVLSCRRWHAHDFHPERRAR